MTWATFFVLGVKNMNHLYETTASEQTYSVSVFCLEGL